MPDLQIEVIIYLFHVGQLLKLIVSFPLDFYE